MLLSDNLSLLPRTSSVTIKKLKSAGLETVRDLLLLKPNRYEDYRVKIISTTLTDGAKGTCSGIVETTKQLFTKSRITIQQVTLRDEFGLITVQFFNQRYLLKTVQVGTKLSCSGVVKRFGTKLLFIPTHYELCAPHIHTGRLLPIYPELKGLSTRLIREKIHILLESATDIKEHLPIEIIQRYSLLPLHTAISYIHRPLNEESIIKATHRLGFEELLKIQIATRKLRNHWNSLSKKVPISISNEDTIKFNSLIQSLPFTLTPDQEKSLLEIKNDLMSGRRMNRFLQGDVGSGKTIVSLLTSYYMYLSGNKTLYMAPTEILAEQQYNSFLQLLKPLDIKIELITGSHSYTKSMNADIYIGTHALLTQITRSSDIGLIIIDEQHRFGVKQRALLSQKGNQPHLLTMTATPIPRTVALTVLGDLDMSVIETLPQGRKVIKTILVTDTKRKDAYTWMNDQITNNKTQIFVVCPLIEGSQSETLQSVKSATTEYERLKKDVFPSQSVALLHGKMNSKDKSVILNTFSKGLISVLVSTSVVEVGIDIPNATIMCIEGAERFGLAQLHQLRGRVGRGARQSYCLLFPTNTQVRNERLEFFTHHNNGMELAEFDLKKRGPGSLYGFQQHGYMDVQFTTLSDMKMISDTQLAADYLITAWKESDYPEFYKTVISFQKELVAKD